MVPTARQFQSKIGRRTPQPGEDQLLCGLRSSGLESARAVRNVRTQARRDAVLRPCGLYEAWKSVLKVLIDKARRP
jgi:hypothetical protein